MQNRLELCRQIGNLQSWTTNSHGIWVLTSNYIERTGRASWTRHKHRTSPCLPTNHQEDLQVNSLVSGRQVLSGQCDRYVIRQQETVRLITLRHPHIKDEESLEDLEFVFHCRLVLGASWERRREDRFLDTPNYLQKLGCLSMSVFRCTATSDIGHTFVSEARAQENSGQQRYVPSEQEV